MCSDVIFVIRKGVMLHKTDREYGQQCYWASRTKAEVTSSEV